MDEMDRIQDAEIAAQEALLYERRRRIEAEAAAAPRAEAFCDDCGCEIPAARLKLRPNTRYCVDCQADVEAKKR